MVNAGGLVLDSGVALTGCATCTLGVGGTGRAGGACAGTAGRSPGVVVAVVAAAAAAAGERSGSGGGGASCGGTGRGGAMKEPLLMAS